MRVYWLGGLLWWLCAMAQAVELDGNITQGGLVTGRTDPGARVEVGGRVLRLTDDGRFVFGLDRDAPASVVLVVTHPDGRVHRQSLDVQPRQYRIQKVDGVPPRTVTPSPEDRKRIEADNRLLRAARTRDLPRTDFLTAFQWPLTGPVTGVFGSQRIYNGEPRSPHYGVDVAQPVGAVVRAPAAGVVSLAHPDMFFSGGTLILDHGHGVSTSYIHLSRLLVKQGQEVEQGEPIAEVGATGRATGPHLHWGMNWFNVRLDPQLLVGPMKE